MVRVTVKFFGPLRDLMQRDEMDLEVPAPHNGGTAFALLEDMTPALQQWRQSVRLAVNFEYASLDHVLKHNDEICFIPPVSGG